MRTPFLFLVSAVVACAPAPTPVAKAGNARVDAIQVVGGVDGVCWTATDASACKPYAGYEARLVVLMVTADTLGRLEAGLAEAQVFSTHASDPIFDLPPKTYDVRVVRDGSETTTRYWHAPGRGVPTAGLDVLAALPPELRPGSLDAIVAENRSL